MNILIKPITVTFKLINYNETIKISLNEELEKFLLGKGAIKVGFTTLETLAGGPPGSDITYVLPEAQSAI
ncbi:MAG: hypothetical protein ACXAES_16695, partial [Promethearchaeota archaeon]